MFYLVNQPQQIKDKDLINQKVYNLQKKLRELKRQQKYKQEQQKKQQSQQYMQQQAQQPQGYNQTMIVEEKVKTVAGEHIVQYQKSGLLSQDSYAKYFQMTNLQNNKIMTAKLIPKNTIVKDRQRERQMQEIKIHKTLHHNNIINLEHVFEDSDNIYILLELYSHQTLNDIIKIHKRISEQEAICYVIQIVQALKYLRKNRVIHRDLKLSGIYVGDKKEIKIGKFSLITKLENDGERKRTICGTSNYIAPDVLAGAGYSYEVDIWHLGVIIYTLLIGNPPFETKDVKDTYKKIKENKFTFPDQIPISDSAKSLIQLILQTDPSARPTLDEILAHPWINNGNIQQTTQIKLKDLNLKS